MLEGCRSAGELPRRALHRVRPGGSPCSRERTGGVTAQRGRHRRGAGRAWCAIFEGNDALDAQLEEAGFGLLASRVEAPDGAPAAARAAQHVSAPGALVQRGPVEVTLALLHRRSRRNLSRWRLHGLGDDGPQRRVGRVDAVEAGEVSSRRRHQRDEPAQPRLGHRSSGAVPAQPLEPLSVIALHHGVGVQREALQHRESPGARGRPLHVGQAQPLLDGAVLEFLVLVDDVAEWIGLVQRMSPPGLSFREMKRVTSKIVPALRKLDGLEAPVLPRNPVSTAACRTLSSCWRIPGRGSTPRLLSDDLRPPRGQKRSPAAVRRARDVDTSCYEPVA